MKDHSDLPYLSFAHCRFIHMVAGEDILVYDIRFGDRYRDFHQAAQSSQFRRS